MGPILSAIIIATVACTAAYGVAVPTPPPSAPSNTTAQQGQELQARRLGPLHTNGRATWYTQDGLEAACGGWYSDNDFVVALPFWRPENCFRTVKIEAFGKVRYARAVDACPTCSHFQLDMSPALFKQFADLDTGLIHLKWRFVT